MDVGQLKGSVVINFGSVREAEKAIKALQGTFNKVAGDSKKLIKAADDLAKSQNAQAQAAKELAKSNTQLAATANRVDTAEKARIKAHAAAEKNLVALSRAERDNLNVTKDTQSALSEARRATQDYRNAVDKLGAGSVGATRAQVRMKAAVDDAKNAIRDSNRNTKNQMAAYKQLVSATGSVETSTRNSVAAEKAKHNALARSEAAEKQMAILIRTRAAVTKESSAAIHRAQQAIRRYNRELELHGAASLEAAQAHRVMRGAMDDAKIASSGLSDSTRNARSWFRSSRAAAAQFGLQLQDVAIQAQMGTNALVILGQQGSQFLGFFGAGGAIAGAALAIGSALLMPLVGGAKSAANALDTLNNVLGETEKMLEDMDGFTKLSEEMKKLARETENVARTRIIVAIQEIENGVRESVSGIADAFSDLDISDAFGMVDLETITEGFGELEAYLHTGYIKDELEELGQMFGQTGDDAYTAGKRIARLLTEARVSGTPDSIIALEEAMAEYIVTSDGATKEARDLAVQLQEYFSQARTAKDRTDFLNHTLENLQAKLRGASNEYEVLADRMDRLEKRRGTSAADVVKAEWEMLKQLKDEYGDITKETRLYREQVALLNRLYADTGNEEYLRILERLNESKEKLGKTTKTAADEAAEYIARLKEESETLGMTRKQLVAYEIAKIAAKDSTIANKNALIEEAQAIVANMEARQKLADRLNALEGQGQGESEADKIKREWEMLKQLKGQYGDTTAAVQEYADKQQFLAEMYERTNNPEILRMMERYAEAFNNVSKGADNAAFSIMSFASNLDNIMNSQMESFTASAAGFAELFGANLSEGMQKGVVGLGAGIDSMMSLLETANRDSSTEYKRMAQMQATVAGALAITKIWGQYAAQPWIAAGLTALVAANTGAQIAAIQSANYATGGLVRGPGTGTSDDIPANLSNGEYVLRADAVRKIGVANLNAMNRGRMANFSSGGLVGGSGGATSIGMNVQVINNNGSNVRTEEGVDENGQPNLRVLIDDIVNEGLSRGRYDRSMTNSFGVRRSGRRV